jgi:hypothetical protein
MPRNFDLPDLPDWRTLGALPSALLGAVIAIAWAGALRGWMAEIAGPDSVFDWLGTFAFILLPAAIVGILLGLADYARRAGGRAGWRWLALAPLLLGIAPLLRPGAVELMFSSGIGSAALVIAFFGILGGYAVSRRGPVWLRIVCGLPALAVVLTGGLATFGFDISAAVEALISGDWEPRQAWAGVTFVSLMIVFAFACSLPHRKVVVRLPYRRTLENGTAG